MSKQIKKQVKVKTQVAVSNRKYINETTGEVEDFTVIQKNVSADFNFHKIWLQDLLNVLDSFGNKKIKVMTYLLSKMRNEDNTVSTTLQLIAKETGISYATVQVTMREMIDSNVIKKIAAGTYQFNPDIIIRGSGTKRQRMLVEYNVIDKNSEDIPELKTSDDYYNEVALEDKKEAIEAEVIEEKKSKSILDIFKK
jgi:DNA-binding Lrp family transcriptional regulator